MSLPLRLITCAALTTAAWAQSTPDLDAARRGLTEFARVCKQSGERLWGRSLCDRVLLVDAGTRITIATAPDPEGRFENKDGLYLGPLPADMLIANTSVRWGGEQWAMILLPLPQDHYPRLRLITHEAFHRIQSALGLAASDAIGGHLDTESGRLWLRMELRALAAALRAEGAASRSAATDALLFRAVRQQLHPAAERLESALEIQEGLAEYTGAVTALEATGESVLRLARSVEDFEDQRSFGRSFAYATGPALGILLDRFAGSWRGRVKKDTNLAGLLAQALKFRAAGGTLPAAEARAARYGLRAVAADERARAVRTEAVLSSYRARFLDGPVLQFPKVPDLQRSFNPNNLVPLGDAGTVYPTGTFAAPWGKLQVDDVGALLEPGAQSLRVTAPLDSRARPLRGPGWRLELAPGWTVRPGAKSGSFDVAPE